MSQVPAIDKHPVQLLAIRNMSIRKKIEGNFSFVIIAND